MDKSVLESQQAMEALNEFEVADKPAEAYRAAQTKSSEKYSKLLNALKVLASDKVINLPLSYLEGCQFASFRSQLKIFGKKAGLKPEAILKGEKIVAFLRS